MMTKRSDQQFLSTIRDILNVELEVENLSGTPASREKMHLLLRELDDFEGRYLADFEDKRKRAPKSEVDKLLDAVFQALWFDEDGYALAAFFNADPAVIRMAWPKVCKRYPTFAKEVEYLMGALCIRPMKVSKKPAPMQEVLKTTVTRGKKRR